MNSVKNELNDESERRLISYQLNSRSFVDEWLDDPRSEDKARRLLSTVLKISTNGLRWATEARRIRRISPELYEIKNFYGATRVMAHIRIAENVVMPRPFKGHSGSGSIPTNTIASATRQQRLVVELLEQEEHDGD